MCLGTLSTLHYQHHLQFITLCYQRKQNENYNLYRLGTREKLWLWCGEADDDVEDSRSLGLLLLYYATSNLQKSTKEVLDLW